MSVRRARRLPLEELAPYLLPAPDPPAPVDWAALFGNDRPVELEVGFGKGLSLLTAAVANPDVNFVGVEVVRKYQLFTATRIAKRGLANVRLACADARLFLRAVEPASVHVLHVYFPDPWPKKRHHKRRLIQEPFILQAKRVLPPGGRLQIVTDHKGYFEENIEPAINGAAAAGWLKIVDYNRPGSAGEGEFVGTNFERKYQREGRPFYALAAVKAAEA